MHRKRGCPVVPGICFATECPTAHTNTRRIGNTLNENRVKVKRFDPLRFVCYIRHDDMFCGLVFSDVDQPILWFCRKKTLSLK
jgi:hypothetical protein